MGRVHCNLIQANLQGSIPIISFHLRPIPRDHGTALSRPVVWIAVLCVFALAFYLVLRNRNTPAAPAGGRRGAAGGTVTLTSTTAKRGSIGVYVDAIGTVTPVYTSSITSQVNGIVTAVHFKEGQMVHKGDPLIDIDSRPYQATLMQAQGMLERDQGVLAQAQMDLARYQAAWARMRCRSRRWTTRKSWCSRMQGTVKNDQGTVAVRPGAGGLLPHRCADYGASRACGWSIRATWCRRMGRRVLAVITQMQPITVVFTVAEDELGQIQPQLQQKAKLTVDAFDRSDQTKIATGTLLTLDNQIDTTTGTVKARAQFANKDSSLFPNQFVNARLLVNTLNDATLIPTAAIQHNGQAAFVYVLAGRQGASAADYGGRDGRQTLRR